jgi:hypothetical protein
MSISWRSSVIRISLKYIGFDIDGVYRTDDTLLDPKVFEEAFASELIGLDTQKLWSHD